MVGLLPPSGRVLDLACGTGRVTRRLLTGQYQVVAADSSTAMLERMLGTIPSHVAQPPPLAVIADAFRLPFRDGLFDAVIAARLLFHYADPGPILREMARVCRPGGFVVFDTVSWSPRAGLALAARRWGGRVFVYPRAALLPTLAAAGLEVAARREAFLISPYLYRLLPLPFERGLEWLEARLPAAWRSRIIWQVQRRLV